MNNQLFNRGNANSRIALIVAFLAVFSLSAFFAACNHSNPLAEQETEETEVVDTSAFKFLYKGKLYESADFQRQFKDKEFPLMVSSTDRPEIVEVFDSEDSFQNWAQTTPVASKLAQIGKVNTEPSNHNQDPTLLSKTSGSAGWAWLAEFRFTGDAFYAYATSILSSLSYFDNKASSVIVYNPSNNFATICSLYKGNSFSGLQYIIINRAQNFQYKVDLSRISGWDNVTSSFIVL